MNGNESSNEPLPSLAVYNPALLKKEDLIAQFVARRAMLDRLVEELRRGGKNGKRHHLIIGPRGSGKTMLLRRLRYAIEDDAELSSGWLPLVFPEEQYNVSRLSDLWVNCLDALSDMLERGNREDESESLDQQIDELPADDEKRRAQAALELLIGRAKREDRGLVLLFDNSDLIFDRLESDHRTIREILSASNRLLFIGAANAPIEATYNHEGAFYDFFKIHEMRGLTDKETREVIFNLARLRRTPQVIETLEREPGRIRALNLLTGGNLRTIVVLYQALAQGKDDSIRADLEQLLDQYTPLYKHRFESLSAQSQQVVDALALNWDPATAAELAEKLRMETNAVSAVLNRLDSDGVVEKAPSPPGEKLFFQIAERFFNIWYLMRASRRVRRKLIWLVEFLKMFYGAEGLYHRARRMVQEPPPEGDQSQHAELALAFARAIEKPSLRRALETEGIRSLMNCGTEDRLRLSSILDLEGEDASLKDMVGRFQSLGELGEKIEQAKDKLPPEFWEYLMTAPALSLEEKKKAFDDVAQLGSDETRQWIEKFESEARRLVELFGAEPCRELFESIRDGRMADGADVEGADAAAIAGKDPSLRVIARLFRFDRTKDEALLGQAEGILTPLVRSPHVRLSWAETLVNSEFCPGAVASIDSKKLAGALKRVGRLKGHDARTWRRIGDLQFRLGRHAEAESAYRKSIALDSDAFTSWNDLGYLLVYWKGSFDEAEAAYRKAIALDPKSASPWFRLGHLLQTYLQRYEEAEAAFIKATELAPNAVLPWGFLVELLMH
ncbi:MAG: AAA family ATPase, partial [Blastocatellia bacterium]